MGFHKNYFKLTIHFERSTSVSFLALWAISCSIVEGCDISKMAIASFRVFNVSWSFRRNADGLSLSCCRRMCMISAACSSYKIIPKMEKSQGMLTSDICKLCPEM